MGACVRALTNPKPLTLGPDTNSKHTLTHRRTRLHTHTHTHRQTDRQTDRHAYTQKEREGENATHAHTHTHTSGISLARSGEHSALVPAWTTYRSLTTHSHFLTHILTI